MNPVEEEIEKIRSVRRKICEEFGDDPRRMAEYFRKISEELRATRKFKFVEAKKQPAPSTVS